MLSERLVMTLLVNGNSYKVRPRPNDTLLQTLRSDLQLTGAKKCCDSGDCGACTVIVDGLPVVSCLIFTAEFSSDQEIRTIEGLDGDELFENLCNTFVAHGAVQCGYCTPGFILAAWALLRSNPGADKEQLQYSLAGNICRCTGYQRILDAILKARRK
jgi:aerobic carbon-monoxide dehydrogenase small subunit